GRERLGLKQLALFRFRSRGARGSALGPRLDACVDEYERKIFARNDCPRAAANRAVAAPDERKSAFKHGLVTDGFEQACTRFELLAPHPQLRPLAALKAVRERAHAFGA